MKLIGFDVHGRPDGRWVEIEIINCNDDLARYTDSTGVSVDLTVCEAREQEQNFISVGFKQGGK